MEEKFNLIVSLASIPQQEHKDKKILDILYSKAEGYSEDRFYNITKNIINDVVGSCVYYPDAINYDNLENINNIFVKNTNLVMKKKLMVVDLREDVSYGENRLILNNELVTVIKGSFY
jgi:hypothetical protein